MSEPVKAGDIVLVPIEYGWVAGILIKRMKRIPQQGPKWLILWGDDAEMHEMSEYAICYWREQYAKCQEK